MEAGNTQLAKRVQELCKEKNMTYKMLAEKSNVSIRRVYHIAHGCISNPGVFTMLPICEALGVTLDEFFDLKSSIDETN